MLFSSSFTIHGLWPYPYKGERKEVDKELEALGIDYWYYNAELYPDTLQKDMDTYMPPAMLGRHPENSLWNHELDKHGRDYVPIIRRFWNSRGTFD